MRGIFIVVEIIALAKTVTANTLKIKKPMIERTGQTTMINCEICGKKNSDPNQKFCTKKCKLIKSKRCGVPKKVRERMREQFLMSFSAPEWHKEYGQFD